MQLLHINVHLAVKELKDLTFDAMHDVTLNIIHHHLLRYLEAGILSRNEIDVRLAAIPWTSGILLTLA